MPKTMRWRSVMPWVSMWNGHFDFPNVDVWRLMSAICSYQYQLMIIKEYGIAVNSIVCSTAYSGQHGWQPCVRDYFWGESKGRSPSQTDSKRIPFPCHDIIMQYKIHSSTPCDSSRRKRSLWIFWQLQCRHSIFDSQSWSLPTSIKSNWFTYCY